MNNQLLDDDDKYWILKKTKHNYISELTPHDKNLVNEIVSNFSKLKRKQLLRHIYLNYPYYAQRSEILNDVLNNSEVKSLIPINQKKKKVISVFSIGYEGKTVDEYLNILLKNNVSLLIDVRKNPLSRKYGFSKKSLSDLLQKVGISYAHFPTLGIESKQRKNLNSYADYVALFKEYAKFTLPRNTNVFREIQHLISKYRRIAFTCFESSPNYCHRKVAAEYLVNFTNDKYKLSHL